MSSPTPVVKGQIGDLQAFFTDASGNRRQPNLYDWPVLMLGMGPGGAVVPLNVTGGGSFAAQSTSLGIAGARFTSADQSGAAAPVTDVPATGKALVITDIRYSVDTDMVITFTEETSGTVLFVEYAAAKSGGQISLQGKLKLAAGKRLQVQTSASGNISVTALYFSE